MSPAVFFWAVLRRRLRLAAVVTLLALAGAGVLASSGGRRGASLAVAPPAATGARDILLITIDTLRADALGFAGNTQVQTPVLDRLARQGLVFRNAHAHNVVTLPSHANILTGLYPYQHGVRDNAGFRLEAGFPTLATWLKARGYATGAFIGAFPLDSRFGLSRGFDVYDEGYPRGRTSLEFELPERPASEVVAAARRWFGSISGKPRFLWIHLYDCHAPYRPPAPFAARYSDRPYLGEVAGVDAALAPLLEPFLSGENTSALIAVTGDHGEALGDHGELTHGLFAYEATLRVPLVLWCPALLRPGVRTDLVRHVDIAPTVLAAAGIGPPSKLAGRSLLSPAPPGPAPLCYFEAYTAAFDRGWAPLRGVLSEESKYIDLPVAELYALRSDPQEKINLYASRREEATTLRRALPPESELSAARRGHSDAGDLARLRSLGYLSGAAAPRKAFGPAEDPKNLIAVDSNLHRGVDLYQRGDLAGATALLRKIVREHPTIAVAYEMLGFLLRQGPSPSEALGVYRQAVARGLGSEQLEAQFALALAEAGRAPEAVALLAPRSNSENPDVLNAYGIALADAGKAAEATGVFQRILNLDRENAEAWSNFGLVRLRQGDAAGASDAFRRALAIDARFSRAWNGLGVALARLERPEEAMDSWRKAVELDPRAYDALYNLALTAGRAGRSEEARSALKRFVATAPPRQYARDLREARRLLGALEGRVP